MSLLSRELYSREEVRKLDEIALKEFSIPGIALMERAGERAFDILKQKWPEARQLAIFCGVGNNGGDGYVLARLALENNYKVVVYQLGDVSKIKGDALIAYNAAIKKGVAPILWQNNPIVADVIVDAILGTGLSAPLSGAWLEVVRQINSYKIPVLSLDIPTGLDANTGNPLGAAICSTITATFIGNKRGMFTGKARDYCGEIFFSSLDVPTEIYGLVNNSVMQLTVDGLQDKLPVRKASAHKGNFGHVVVIGGAPSMGGAVRMAGEAALRAGAGLVSVITHPSHAGYIAAVRPELICFGADDDIVEVLEKVIAKKAVILLGPGLGQLPWSRKIFAAVLKTKLPMIIDADGLNLLAEYKEVCGDCILTPHPGEAARLLRTTVENIETDRFQSLLSLREKFKSTIVLKGAGTLVTYQSKIGVCCAGNAKMATAGMGDILAGIIAGLLAQQLDHEDAAAAGVCLHAAAGDIVSKQSSCGIIATDLLPYIRIFS